MPGVALWLLRMQGVAGHEVRVTTSLGVAIHESGALDAKDLLARADKAMYVAKRAGKNCVSVG